MRDHFFFPLAILLLVALVVVALIPGAGALPTGSVTGDGEDYSVITIEGRYLNKVYAGGDAITRLEKDALGKRVLYIEAEVGRLSDNPELGPHFKLAGDVETQFSGMTIRITVTAKPAVDGGAENVALNYSAGQAGGSGWKIFPLGSGKTDISFEYKVPLVVGDQGNDFLAIRPVVPIKSRALIVEKITMERLGPWGQSGS
jgi:hypothetical protein